MGLRALCLAFSLAAAVGSATASGQMSGVNLTVTTVLSPPYVISHGDGHFEGFSIDLMQRISEILGFSYTVKVAEDMAYGRSFDGGNSWNGMIGELLSNKADVAVADLTMTDEREKAVHFTPPFMNFGITTLYKKPKDSTSHLNDAFVLFAPFSPEVWACIVVAHLAMALIHHVFARLSASTKLVSGMWWFFTLLTLGAYAAALTGVLCHEGGELQAPFFNAGDLADQSAIKYGLLKGGSTARFFKQSKVPAYSKMWEAMNRDPSASFVGSFDECVARAAREDFACFAESPSIQYVVERQCDLMQVGGLLNSRAFGIALPKDSPYNAEFDRAVRLLHEQGELKIMKEVWWEDHGAMCSRIGQGGPAQLGIYTFRGAFAVLAAGLGIACFVALLHHFVWKKMNLDEKLRLP